MEKRPKNRRIATENEQTRGARVGPSRSQEVARMARWFSIRPGITFKGRAFKGLRGWAGKPTHPPLTDFPIVAYVLTAVFDLISYVRGEGYSVARDFFVSGTHVIIAGAIVSLLTALT